LVTRTCMPPSICWSKGNPVGAGSFGSGERWYMQGPWPEGTKSQGYQTRLAPAELYRAGIKAVDAYCRKTFQERGFSSLTSDEQDNVLSSLEKGEVALEQAYLDFLIKPWINIRAGMVLTPVGLINERHEPPAFNGVERPFVETVIIPTTWREMGFGAIGDLGRGLRYRAYLLSGLDATGFDAGMGIAEGRTDGFGASFRNPAKVARLEYTGLPLHDAHTRFHLTSEEFDEVGAEIVRALQYYKVPDAETKLLVDAYMLSKPDVVASE